MTDDKAILKGKSDSEERFELEDVEFMYDPADTLGIYIDLEN